MAEPIEVSRFESHHVLLDRDGFTLEHPPTCDLTACGLHGKLVEAWSERPGPLGWHKVSESGELSPPEERKTYLVIEVDRQGGE